MLNWDEYNIEETQADPAIKSAAPEVPKQAQSVSQQEKVTETSVSAVEEGSRAAAARKAMETFDVSEGVKELDEMYNGRVQVDDKAMINCKAPWNSNWL